MRQTLITLPADPTPRTKRRDFFDLFRWLYDNGALRLAHENYHTHRTFLCGISIERRYGYVRAKPGHRPTGQPWV
jgi:hypothetical protein